MRFLLKDLHHNMKNDMVRRSEDLGAALRRVCRSLKPHTRLPTQKVKHALALVLPFTENESKESKADISISTTSVVDYSDWAPWQANVVDTTHWSGETSADWGTDQEVVKMQALTPYEAIKHRTGYSLQASRNKYQDFHSRLPGAWSLETLIQVEDQLRHLVYQRAQALWPALFEELQRCGPMLVSFDWEHVDAYNSLTDFEGLETPPTLIREALADMNAVRRLNSHRWSYTYEDGFQVDGMLRICHNLACTLLDEALAAEIRAHRTNLEAVEHLTPKDPYWDLFPGIL